MTADKIERTWFSDEQIFTVGLQIPTNTQSDRIYVRGLKKRDVTPGSVKSVVNLLFLLKNDHLRYDRIYIMMAKGIIANFGRLILE